MPDLRRICNDSIFNDSIIIELKYDYEKYRSNYNEMTLPSKKITANGICIAPCVFNIDLKISSRRIIFHCIVWSRDASLSFLSSASSRYPA